MSSSLPSSSCAAQPLPSTSAERTVSRGPATLVGPRFGPCDRKGNPVCVLGATLKGPKRSSRCPTKLTAPTDQGVATSAGNHSRIFCLERAARQGIGD